MLPSEFTSCHDLCGSQHRKAQVDHKLKIKHKNGKRKTKNEIASQYFNYNFLGGRARNNANCSLKICTIKK